MIKQISDILLLISFSFRYVNCFLFFFIAATIFAYGQTSSGKTFTMRGVTDGVVKDIYEHISKVSGKFKVPIPWFVYTLK